MLLNYNVACSVHTVFTIGEIVVEFMDQTDGEVHKKMIISLVWTFPYCKIWTTQGTNQNAPFHHEPVANKYHAWTYHWRQEFAVLLYSCQNICQVTFENQLIDRRVEK